MYFWAWEKCSLTKKIQLFFLAYDSDQPTTLTKSTEMHQRQRINNDEIPIEITSDVDVDEYT
jgi:hypothetical protein